MSEWILNTLLGVVGLAVAVSMWRFHSNPHFQHFNLLDLITTNDGKISRPAVMEMGAFVLMTWGFIVLVQRDKLMEWYAGIYVGAFVLRAAHSAWLNCKQQPETAAQSIKEG